MDINIARDLIAQTDEGSYYLGLGMSLWYTGTEEYIEGRNCPVFVIGTDHEEHFTKEKYYAAGDNVVYYYDPLGDAWLCWELADRRILVYADRRFIRACGLRE